MSLSTLQFCSKFIHVNICSTKYFQTFPPKLVELDFSDMKSMPEVVSDVLDCYGCVDVLIFNSSMKVKAPVQTLSLEMDKLVMDANYFGPITLAKGTKRSPASKPQINCIILLHISKTLFNVHLMIAGVLPSMITRRSGHIILVNSIQGKLAVPFRTSCEFS